MKRNQKFAVGFALLAVMGLVASVGLVSAYRGDPSAQGPSYDEETHVLMMRAFDDLDYQAWYDVMEAKGVRGRVLDVIDEENFEVFVEAHNAALAGDDSLAAQLRSQIGLGDGKGSYDAAGYHAGGQGKGRAGSAQGAGQGLRGAGACLS